MHRISGPAVQGFDPDPACGQVQALFKVQDGGFGLG